MGKCNEYKHLYLCIKLFEGVFTGKEVQVNVQDELLCWTEK